MVPVLIIITDASAPSPTSPYAWEEILNYILRLGLLFLSLKPASGEIPALWILVCTKIIL